jgi:hypothetical protein
MTTSRPTIIAHSSHTGECTGCGTLIMLDVEASRVQHDCWTAAAQALVIEG